ncbi:MAG: hypothetical protein BZ151_12940 [Desulfobacca sp. 4484_104]|nr:MAG: hypothetical protein BZ151_12940 [Desulfobacca sp. 4484_104]RLB68564.1 MAG: polysaccharide biosynthesis protein [Deltaproteobacteria bacterium]
MSREIRKQKLNFLTPTPTKRKLFFFIGDLISFSLALMLAYVIRFDLNFPPYYQSQFLFILPIFLAVKFTCFSLFKLYGITWRFVSLNEIWNIVKASLLSLATCGSILYFSRHQSFFSGFSRSVLLIDFLLTMILTILIRGSKRIYLEKIARTTNLNAKECVILGAGRAGEQIARDLLQQYRSNSTPYKPVAFLDDDQRKIGGYIHGIKVEGKLEDIHRLIDKRQIQAAIIAIPSAAAVTLRKIVNLLKTVKINDIKILSSIIDSSRAIELTIKDLRNLQIEDLLGRDVIKIDYQSIGSYLKGKRILITGAAGSIGSEISQQVISFCPEQLILYEIDETELYNLGKTLNPTHHTHMHMVVGDIRDMPKLQRLFARFKPQIIFHAAACKQVPIMEDNPDEAVHTNIIGTYNLAIQAVQHQAEKFVLISTDKAVNPTSVMGATKRIAEYICTGLNKERDGTQFLAVRFGNVLGSRGGVLELFLEQLKNGGPLTVTHPEMKRYFMTIPEAVSLVLQAGAISVEAEVLVLDMGKPLSITTMAEEVIRLNGMEPYRDVKINYVGVRPGEKLFEELLTAEEGTCATCHQKIFTANISTRYRADEIHTMVNRFRSLLQQDQLDKEEIKALIRSYVPNYTAGETINLANAHRRPQNQRQTRKTA